MRVCGFSLVCFLLEGGEGDVRSGWVAGDGADAWDVFEGSGGRDSFDELFAEGLEAVFGGHFFSLSLECVVRGSIEKEEYTDSLISARLFCGDWRTEVD